MIYIFDFCYCARVSDLETSVEKFANASGNHFTIVTTRGERLLRASHLVIFAIVRDVKAIRRIIGNIMECVDRFVLTFECL